MEIEHKTEKLLKWPVGKQLHRRSSGRAYQTLLEGCYGLNTVCPSMKLPLTFNAHNELLGGEISWGFKRQLRVYYLAWVNPLIELLDILSGSALKASLVRSLTRWCPLLPWNSPGNVIITKCSSLMSSQYHEPTLGSFLHNLPVCHTILFKISRW